jgi:hypothetical protein
MGDINRDNTIYNELLQFSSFWLANTPFKVPEIKTLDFSESLSGMTLFREGRNQVQLFIIAPNSIILSHSHPDVDVMQVHLGGDIAFEFDGLRFGGRKIMDKLRLSPGMEHKAFIGPEGAAYLSIQVWQNGVEPISLREDWLDNTGKKEGTASPTDISTFNAPTDALVIPSEFYEEDVIAYREGLKKLNSQIIP